MSRRVVLVALVLIMLALIPSQAMAAVGNAALYAKYQGMFEKFTIYCEGKPTNKIGKSVDLPATDGAVAVLFMDQTGNKQRYRVNLYGESGYTQCDYYLLDGALLITDLRTNFSNLYYFPDCEVLYFEFAKYVQDGSNWYRLDDAGELAYKVSEPDIHLLKEVEREFEAGDLLEEGEY